MNIRNLPDSPFAVKDEMDMYPRIYPIADGRLLITNDGGAGGGNISGKKTYLAKIGPGDPKGGPPVITFQRGPELPEGSSRKVYSSAVPDPNSSPGDFLSLGGMVGYEDTNIGPGNPPSNPATMHITADLRRYHAPGNPDDVGSWEEVKNFLGPDPTDVRIMHVATLLPTKQILVVGGGNYPYHDPLVRPILLTAKDKTCGGLPPGIHEPRNPAEALSLRLALAARWSGLRRRREPRSGRAVGRTARSGSTLPATARGPTASSRPVASFIPVENWQVEIFSPPYLFKSGPRPEITDAHVPGFVAFGETGKIEVQHATPDAKVVLIKLGWVTHGWDLGQRLADLKVEQVFEVTTPEQTKASVKYTAPTNRDLYPPGYYMLFYVNNQGQPSIAKMVRLG